MKIQVFSQYYNLAQAGRVEPLACVMHPEDPDITYKLIHKEENEKIVLQCLACGAKILPTERLYKDMLRDIENATA
jgi:hypothetical protein